MMVAVRINADKKGWAKAINDVVVEKNGDIVFTGRYIPLNTEVLLPKGKLVLKVEKGDRIKAVLYRVADNNRLVVLYEVETETGLWKYVIAQRIMMETEPDKQKMEFFKRLTEQLIQFFISHPKWKEIFNAILSKYGLKVEEANE